MDATRISDGKQVMLKMLPYEEGPYELEINKLFSTEPVSSNPRNRCVQMLGVIRLPGDPPIIAQPLLRPFYEPRLQTYGEFVTFFAQVCEVSPICPLITPYSLLTSLGRPIQAREQRRSPVCCYLSHARFLSSYGVRRSLGIARPKTGIRGRGAQRGTS